MVQYTMTRVVKRKGTPQWYPAVEMTRRASSMLNLCCCRCVISFSRMHQAQATLRKMACKTPSPMTLPSMTKDDSTASQSFQWSYFPTAAISDAGQEVYE